MKVLKYFFNILSLLALSALIMVTVSSVFMRYVVQKPFGWSEEVSLVLFVWLVMSGAAIAEIDDEHVSIDIFIMKMPVKHRLIIKCIELFITTFSFLVIIYLSIKLMGGAWEKVTPILYVPYTFIDLAIPVGLLGILVFRIVRYLSKKRYNKGKNII